MKLSSRFITLAAMLLIVAISLPCLGATARYSGAYKVGVGGLVSTGEITGAGPKFYASAPLTCTANTTVNCGVLVAQRAMVITKISVAFVTPPASSAGTVTLALKNYDLSATTDDNLLSTATVDLEALTAKTASNLTVTTTAADLTLAAGDYVYAAIVSNNADMTASSGGVITIEYTLR